MKTDADDEVFVLLLSGTEIHRVVQAIDLVYRVIPNLQAGASAEFESVVRKIEHAIIAGNP